MKFPEQNKRNENKLEMNPKQRFIPIKIKNEE
jgi:hypothetical protein